MTKFLLIRHGVTDWNLERRIQGQSDIPLNGAGLKQAETLAGELARQQFDLVLSSDLKRAAQTAQILASRLIIPIQFDKRLREVNHGRWEGMLISDLHDNFENDYAAFRNNPISSHAPGGESLDEAAQRITSVIDETSIRFPTGRVLVVSHGLVLALLRCRINGEPLHMSHQFGLDNCGSELISWTTPTEAEK